MPHSPFVLADRGRIEQFGRISSQRGLFNGYTSFVDSQGITWAEKRFGPYCLAATWLGPGWVFDDYGRSRRAGVFEERRLAMASADAARHAEELAGVIGRMHLGRLAERLLWVIHRKVLEQKRSVIVLADFEIGNGLWGRDRNAWPNHWRQNTIEILQGLIWLHVAEYAADGSLLLGTQSALLTNIADMRHTSPERCPDYCPGLDGARHHHYLVNIGRGFLGILERFAQGDDEAGERLYDFPIGTARSSGTTLRRVGKIGRLTSLYLPAKLGDPQSCGSLDVDQHRVLQMLVGETTRKKRRGRQSLSGPHVFVGNRVPGLRSDTEIECPLLPQTGNYIGFNGNKKRWGQGYLTGTWAARAGFARDAGAMFDTIANMPAQIGLIIAGLEPGSGSWYALSQLQAMSASASGRRTLSRLHLRAFTSADYIPQWNSFFQWPGPMIEPVQQGNRAFGLLAALQRHGVTKLALATGIGKDASLVSKILTGKRRCSDAFIAQAEAWIASLDSRMPSVESPVPQIIPTGDENASGLAMAAYYQQRGWVVIPQVSGEKRPPIKWKLYQTQRPTDTELQSWWNRWPNAGVALIAGTLSGVFVVDVDGTEAHNALLQHLGTEPLAPKVLSGSRQPNRYHLFFLCPTGVTTKAKATPWHPNLEFRGNRSLAVLPPSLHKSGNRYVWAPGQSLDDLPMPELPAEIIAALQPVPRASCPRPEPVPGLASNVAASPATRDFLTGRYANSSGWNDRLYQAACDLHGRGVAMDEAEPLLLTGAQPWDLSEAECARKTIASAFSQPREPGQF
ncbi:MAG: bifunctional DNA primase/polymerase [Planctomycetota bacterium]